MVCPRHDGRKNGNGGVFHAWHAEKASGIRGETVLSFFPGNRYGKQQFSGEQRSGGMADNPAGDRENRRFCRESRVKNGFGKSSEMRQAHDGVFDERRSTEAWVSLMASSSPVTREPRIACLRTIFS